MLKGRVEELSFDQSGMSVQTSRQGDLLHTMLSGVAELAVRDRLTSFLKAIHSSAAGSEVQEVAMDLSRLEFMNTACFRAFVGWIQDLQELPHDRQYRIRFRSNSGQPWQRRSINALKCFATDLIIVETGN